MGGGHLDLWLLEIKAKVIFQFTHFCGRVVGELTSQSLLSIKICSIRIKFYG